MTAEMLPQCNIIAYFYHAEYEEVIADSLQFSVDMAFENDVSNNTNTITITLVVSKTLFKLYFGKAIQSCIVVVRIMEA